MLKNLLIQNYALIDYLEIEFHQGLNIITGETGAGKSILLGALGLILGNRAETNVLKDKTKACVVEGLFDISGYNLHPFFIDNNLEYFDNTIIRRHINPTGKSRAFVNELPVNLNVIKDLVGKIIDIHSQHENLLLANSTFQISVLDSYAENSIRLDTFKHRYERYKQLSIELAELRERSQKAKADLDYIQFQFVQLDDAKLKSGEDVELETLQQQLAHSEEIKSALLNVSRVLNADDNSVLYWLKEAELALRRITKVYPAASEMTQRIEASRIDLRDLSQEIETQNEKVELDPNQLEAVTKRLDMILTLQQKHRSTSVDELIEMREKFRKQLDEIVNFDVVLEQKLKEHSESENKAFALAEELSTIRREVSSKFEGSIKSLLNQLGMPYANFKVDFVKQAELRPLGIDKITFLFSANKQMPLQELSRVASGGELSRLMLSLKSLMVKMKGLPTIILDEIDTGVSGEVADKVGNIIYNISNDMQVINITHLPQIASKGKNHFLVYKDHDADSSKTLIRLLSADERVTEIAKMLSGEKISEAAYTNARHLLNNGLHKL